MKINFKKLFLISSALIFFSAGLFFAQSVLAAPLDLGLQPLEATGLGHADIRIIIANIIKVAFGLLGILAVGLMLYAGYEWMTSGGNDEQIAVAKKILINATIGLAIILSAYSIVAFVMTKLVEATGYNGGVSPECKAQIDAGGKNCDGKCPACDPSCVGNDCGPNSPLFIKQKPIGGNVCIHNFHPVIIFSKGVQLSTVQNHIVIIESLNLKNVDGKWDYVSGDTAITFYPNYANSGCPDGLSCFLPNTKYQLQFKNYSEILSKDGNILQCGFTNKDCSPIDFTTGGNVDLEKPKINIVVPSNGDSFEQGKTLPVKVNFSDGGGIQNINLNVDGNLINSILASPNNNCATSGEAIINWPTDKFSLGSHLLNAFALDWAINKGEDSKTVSLKPAYCFNQKLDINLGEKFIDCGGECGVCAGGKCLNDIDCASGYCEIKNNLPKDGKNEGVCIDKMRIDDFSPPSAAIGDYFSIFGKYFGTSTGHVYFSSSQSGKWVEAQVVNCGNGFKNWTNNQIIVSVPGAIASSGPIRVETVSTTGKDGIERKFIDLSNDSWGPKPGLQGLGNFVLSDIPHPGLCLADPNNGPIGTSVKIYGKGFGLIQEADDSLKFQDFKAGIVNWSESLINTVVPSGLDNGDFGIQVKKKGMLSNGIKFTISGSNPNGPIITGLSSNKGVKLDYLVIYGKNFGKKSGNVFFKLNGKNDLDSIFLGNNEFPTICVGSVWSDNKVIIKIPSDSKLTMGENYTVQVKNIESNLVSPLENNFAVKINVGIPAPGICKISPASGPVPFIGQDYVAIYGENFAVGGVSAYFWKDGAVMPTSSVDFANVYETFAKITPSSVVNEGGGQKLLVQPSAEVKTGAVFLYHPLIDKPSNPSYFSVFDCTKNKNTCADVNQQCCAIGTQNGMCIPKTDTCAGVKHNAGYVWLFSTGGISQSPQVVERCNADTEAGLSIPTPAPSTIWNTSGSNDASNVCQTAVATVEFNMAMDQATVNANSLKLYTCDSVDGNQCKNSKPVDSNLIHPDSYKLQISNNNANNVLHHYLSIALKDNQKWTSSTWHQVVLSDSIKSLPYKNKYNQDIQFNLSATKACGNGTAYCYVFRTGMGECKLKQVIITPSQFWTNVLEEPIRYHAIDGSAYDITYSGNGLSEQRCIMMNTAGFDWLWTPVSTNYIKRLSMFGPGNRFAQFGSEANTVGIGLPGDSVNINASAAVTVNGVQISKNGTSTLTIDLSNPKVVDYEPKCLEACTNALVSATFNVSMSEKNLNTAVKLYKCNDENCLSTEPVVGVGPAIESKSINDNRWLKIFNLNNAQSLLPNTLYQVVLSASTTPDIKKGDQLWSLANATLPMSYSKPFNQEFSWRFRTKKEACVIDKVEVSPKLFTAQKLDDRAVFVAQPYSAPDACSVYGQKLNPFKSSWAWSSSDLQVATVQSFTTKGNSPYCTSNCLLKGSDIASGGVSASYPVCGNDKVEAGEDCVAPDKANNCSLNCLNIVKTKKGSQINTESKDVKASICGNGLVGVDEDCDLGIAASPSVSSSAMFCGANCLHLGTPLSSAWCKDHKVDRGGFAVDEFNKACGQALSRCGDGIADYNEDPGCDIGAGKYDVTCNDRCLKLVRCQAGEVGCSPDGQKQGSSLIYPVPSVCGDGVVGAGEDATCDNVNNFVAPIKSLVDPWALAIGQGGGQPAGQPPVQSSNITGTANNKSGVGKYQVQCGWKDDLECSSKYSDPNRGVGNDSCCYLRPQLTKVYPGSTDAVANNICINTYIEADFDSVIDVNTLPGNLLLAKFDENGATCASGTQVVDNALIANLSNLPNLVWYQKIWYQLVWTIKNIFNSNFAQASVWCAGSDLASPSVVPDSNGGSKIILQLNKALSTSTKYAVILKPGIKDTKGVKIRYGNNKPLGWQFITGANICEVSTVSIDPEKKSFNVANISAAFTALARTQNKQLIVPIPGYAWVYSWGPKNNDYVTVADTTGNINNIISQNRNGEVDVYASAKITDNKFTKQTGLVGTGRSHVIVFLCENPWPPLNQKVDNVGPFTIFPYEDTSGNNDNFNITKNIFDTQSIPPSEVVNAGYFNFSTYYCADSGSSGSTVDDLPYLKPAVQTEKSILGVTSAAQGVCENSINKLCSADSECAVNQYIIYGHSFTVPASNPKICIINYNGGSYSYYFSSDQPSGQPLACLVDSDCDSLKTSSDYIKGLGVGVTCKSIAGNSHQTLDLKCSKPVTPFSALKRFIFTSNKNSDAIGVQILSNPNHLTARQWFELDKKSGGQGFVSQAGLQDLQIDGYDAVSDGNNIYINALNFTPSALNSNSGNLYTNTYLFSVNPDANNETKKVFDQVLKNVKFNINLTNDKRCIVPGNGPTDNSVACMADFDCPLGQVCSAQKEKLQRDFQRLQDMGQIFNALDNYKIKHNKTYPDLKAGTYLTGQTVSTWPSWSVLGNAVGASLPSDPVNKLGLGGTCVSSTGAFCLGDSDCVAQTPAGQKCLLHDPTTGWSTANQRFSFACPPDSLAYRYIATSTSSTVAGADNYMVKLNWEIIGLNNQGLNILNKTNLFNDFIPASAASKFDLNSNTGICNQSKEITSLVIGTCGDGKVGKNEDCDPPGGLKWKLSECGVPGVVSSTILHGDICSPTCKWNVNATSTTCGTKLAKCNNSLVEVGEVCDDGVLNGKYGHCNAACSGFAPTCGDGSVDPVNEVCDTKVNYSGWCVGGIKDNTNCVSDNDCKQFNAWKSQNGKCVTLSLNSNKYGLTKTISCASDCQKYGPYCGDGIVQSEFGEECDGSQFCSIGSDAGQRICSQTCRWQNNSAIVYYKFDDIWWLDKTSYIPNSATFSDFKAYCVGNASQDCPAPTSSMSVSKKQAMYFNGSSNYFTVDHQPNFDLKQLTIATWIKVATTSESGKFYAILSKQDVSKPLQPKRDYDFYFHTTSSGAVDMLGLSSRNWINNSNQEKIFGETAVAPNGTSIFFEGGEWHFVAVTMDLTRMAKYYIDGQLVGTDQANGSVTSIANGQYDIWIGLGDPASVGGKYFNGSLDDIQLYGRALSAGEIKDLYTNSANFCEANTTPATPPPPVGCGNGKVDSGEVCDKGNENGIACVSSYNKSCTYCASDCKNVITVSAAGYCGDSLINGPEKCESDSLFVYSTATSSGTSYEGTGLSTLSDKSQNGGYKVLLCELEYNITLNASSTYWYNEFLQEKSGAKPKSGVENNLIGKVGIKSCVANCGIGSANAVQDSCVACGLSSKGVVVSGAVINVLDPKGNNPLVAEPAAAFPPNGHLGYLDLLYPQKNFAATGNIDAYKVAYDRYGIGNSFSSYKLRPTNGLDSVDATIEANPICSDKNQPRYYRMALNADWSNEHMIDFPIFGFNSTGTYNLLVSPVIAQNSVSSTVNTPARPNDLRVVVSWVGKDVDTFSAGLVRPTQNILTIFSPNTANATGINYFNQPDDNGVWFHGFGSNSDYNANVEAFTIDTTKMTAAAYAFFVKTSISSAKISQAGKDAKLKVEIYAAEPQRALENNDVYRHFARPIKTFYFSQALPSSNPDAQYWHVFNILKDANPTAEYAAHFSVGSQFNSIRTDIKLDY